MTGRGRAFLAWARVTGWYAVAGAVCAVMFLVLAPVALAAIGLRAAWRRLRRRR